MFGQLLKQSHHQLARISSLLLIITHCSSNSSFLNEITILSFHLNLTFYILSGSLGYYNVENTNRKLDLEGVFDSIGATSRQAVKKGNYKN